MSILDDIKGFLKENGFYRDKAHFKISSGRHSSDYIHARLAIMLDSSARKEFAEKVISLTKELNPTAVAGFTVGGILLAKEISELLHVPLVVGKSGTTSGIEWIDGLDEESGRCLLLVDDILTTGLQLKHAIAALEQLKVTSIAAIVVAIDSSDQMSKPVFEFRGNKFGFSSCSRLALDTYDPSNCPMCGYGVPLRDLSSPERNVMSAISAQPREKAQEILRGYAVVYELQKEEILLKEVEAWKPWVGVVASGLPITRLDEDARLIRFILFLQEISKTYKLGANVISDLVGELIRLTSVKIEARSVGCCLIVGAYAEVLERFTTGGLAKVPDDVTCANLDPLQTAFDAFLETSYIFIADASGHVQKMRRLLVVRAGKIVEGLEALRVVTEDTNSIGFVIKRGRRAISVYVGGHLAATAEASENNGIWDFSRPMQGVSEISLAQPGLSRILVRVIEVAREMVARRYGGLFVIGDASALKYDPPHIQIEPKKIDSIAIEDLVEIAKLDGAILINEAGILEKASVIIKGAGDKVVEVISSGRGGGRSQAAKQASIACPCGVCVCVSQNGSITIFDRGVPQPISWALPGLSG